MAEFGKRARQGSTRQQSAPAAPAYNPRAEEMILPRDLKQIEQGRVPAWANMSKARLAGLLVLFPGLLLAALWCYAPEVVRDVRYAGTYVAATDLRATDGTCKRYMFLVTMCSAKIRSLRDNEAERTSSFLMFFRSGDGALLLPVRSTADASAVGIEYSVSTVLLNRTLSLLGIMLVFGWAWWTFFDWFRKGRYKDGPAYAAMLQHMALHSQLA